MTTILAVEDDPDFLNVVVHFLRGAGYEVLAADNADTAFEIIKSDKKIDLAIVDFWLRGRPSIPVLDTIADHRACLPVIVMTGGAGKYPVEYSHAIANLSGAHAFLQKPFRRDAFLSQIAGMLGAKV